MTDDSSKRLSSDVDCASLARQMSDITFEFVIFQNTCYGPVQGVSWI